MSSSNQSPRLFGLAGKQLIIVGLLVVGLCVGVSAAALVVSRLASTVTTALNQPAATPEDTRRPPGATPIRTATPLPTPTLLPFATPPPAPTPTPEPGQSRSRPLPPNTLVRSGD